MVEVRAGAEGRKGAGGGREGEASGGTHLERVGARVFDAAGLDEELLHLHVIEDGRVAPPGGRTKRGLGTSQDAWLEPLGRCSCWVAGSLPLGVSSRPEPAGAGVSL